VTDKIRDLNTVKTMTAEVLECSNHHRWRFGDAVTTLMRKVSLEYENQLESLLAVPYGRKMLNEFSSDLHDALFAYLVSMQWVGWGDCEFGPPLELPDDSGIYALSLIAYLGARLMDDAIDHHLDYKGQFQSFYGYLTEKSGRDQAAGISAAAGHFLITASIRRMVKRGSLNTACSVMQLYNPVFAGALCETGVNEIAITPGLYRSVIRHKAVAYDRILHVVFFRKAEPLVRERILSFLATHSEYSQWLNDLSDEADDRSRNQMSILKVTGMDRDKLINTILKSFLELWNGAGDLHPDIRNVMAVRLNDSLKKLTRADGGGPGFPNDAG